MTGVSEHYFTADPVSDGELRTLAVSLAGRGLELYTAGGVFSPGRLDRGTEVLLSAVPKPPPSGHLLDLGCGWGPISLALALRAPAASVWAVDVNARALDLVRRNALRSGCANVHACRPDDVPDDVRFAAVWSNPPIRIGKAALHELLLHWLPRLEPGGRAYLVVQRNLGSDSLQAWLDGQLGGRGFEVARCAADRGFRVLEVTAPETA